MKWTLAAIALILGALAPFAGSPYRRREVSAIELAYWIKDRKPGLHVIDLRSKRDFDAFHVPTSVQASSIDAHDGDTVVVVSDSPVTIDRPNIYVLRGGARAWINEVTPTAIGNYFGGTRRGGC